MHLPKHAQTTNARIHSFRSTCMTSAPPAWQGKTIGIVNGIVWIMWVKNRGVSAIALLSPDDFWVLLEEKQTSATNICERGINRLGVQSHETILVHGSILLHYDTNGVDQLLPTTADEHPPTPGAKVSPRHNFSKARLRQQLVQKCLVSLHINIASTFSGMAPAPHSESGTA